MRERQTIAEELRLQEEAKKEILSLLKERKKEGKKETPPETLVNLTRRHFGYRMDSDIVKRAIWSLAAEDVAHFSPMNEIVLGPMPKR